MRCATLCQLNYTDYARFIQKLCQLKSHIVFQIPFVDHNLPGFRRLALNIMSTSIAMIFAGTIKHYVNPDSSDFLSVSTVNQGSSS